MPLFRRHAQPEPSPVLKQAEETSQLAADLQRAVDTLLAIHYMSDPEEQRKTPPGRQEK